MTRAVTIRAARVQDLEDFVTLWSECSDELASAYGAELVPKSIEYFIAAFNWIVEDSSRGIVLFAEFNDNLIGVLMWGEVSNAAMPTKFGRIAVGFGTYVREPFRKKGISQELRCAAVSYLRLQGFDTLLGAVHAKNDVAEASLKEFEIHQHIYTLDLSKPYKGV